MKIDFLSSSVLISKTEIRSRNLANLDVTMSSPLSTPPKDSCVGCHRLWERLAQTEAQVATERTQSRNKQQEADKLIRENVVRAFTIIVAWILQDFYFYTVLHSWYGDHPDHWARFCVQWSWVGVCWVSSPVCNRCACPSHRSAGLAGLHPPSQPARSCCTDLHAECGCSWEAC